MHRYLTAALAAISLFAVAGSAQIVGGRFADPKTKGEPKPTPRLADGKPDLGNGKGIWNPRTIANVAGTGNQGAARSPIESKPDAKLLPWAEKAYNEALNTLSKDDPEARCLPPGIPRMYATPFPFQIYQHPDRVIFIFEGGAHVWRVIYTDGRPHAKDPTPTYLGDSIGHWDGDTLVVDVVGFNDRTWLDQDGHPHSDALHVIERFTRINEGTLRYQYTIDDPKTYEKPWTSSFLIPWVAGEELMEYICQENNTDLHHMVGK